MNKKEIAELTKKIERFKKRSTENHRPQFERDAYSFVVFDLEEFIAESEHQ